MGRAVFVLALFCEVTLAEGVSVFGAAGYGKTYDDEGNIGNGVSAHAGLSHRVSRRFSAGGEYALLTNKRELPFATWRGRSHHVAANLFAHFGSGNTQPYVVGGLGVLHHEVLSEPRVLAGPNSATGWAWSAGFGVRGYVTERVFLRPEVRLWVGSGGIKRVVEPLLGTLQFSLGIGYTVRRD